MDLLHYFGPNKSLILLAFFWHDFTNSGLTIWYLMLQYEHGLVHEYGQVHVKVVEITLTGWFTGIDQVGSLESIRFKVFTILGQVRRFHTIGSRSRFDTTFEQVGSMILPTQGTHPDSNTNKHTQQGTLPHTLTAR